MALATTGAKGGEKIAIKWAKQKAVTVVLAKADFDKNGRAAPFRANDELIALEPDVILASGGTVVAPLMDATRSVPIVFTQTPDPVAAGFVALMLMSARAT